MSREELNLSMTLEPSKLSKTTGSVRTRSRTFLPLSSGKSNIGRANPGFNLIQNYSFCRFYDQLKSAMAVTFNCVTLNLIFNYAHSVPLDILKEDKLLTLTHILISYWFSPRNMSQIKLKLLKKSKFIYYNSVLRSNVQCSDFDELELLLPGHSWSDWSKMRCFGFLG